MAVLRRLIYGGSRQPTEQEAAILNAVATALPEPWRERFLLQVNNVELVQRTPTRRLVTFHFFEKGDGLRFSNRSEELDLADVQLRTGTQRLGHCRVVFHHGLLSSLEYTKDLQAFGDRPLELEVHLLADPGRPDVDRFLRPIDFGPLLKTIAPAAALSDVKAPAPQTELDKLHERLGEHLPAGYRELLRETDGFRTGHVLFYGSHPRRVVRRDGDIEILAENESRAVGLVDGRFVVFDHVNDEAFLSQADLLTELRRLAQ